MCLEFRQVETPNLAEIADEEFDYLSIGGRSGQCQEVAHQAGIPAPARALQLEFQEVTVAVAVLIRAEGGAETQQKMGIIQDCGGQEVQSEDRKTALPPWGRNVLVPQLGEAVVGRHEQVVAGYAGPGIIGRPLAWHRQGVLVPKALYLRFLLPPSLQGTVMQGRLVQLPVRAREGRRGFCPVITAALAVVEGLVTDGAPAV